MTSILAVDLAAKLSAAIQRGLSGQVVDQFDSRNKTPLDFCKQVAQAATDCDIVVVEDVPYGISSQFMIKPVLRLQGALVTYLTAYNALDRALFMSPSTWMKEFPGVQHAPRGMTKAAGDKHRIEVAAHFAKEAGYEPPDLVSEYVDSLEPGKKVLKKNTNVLEKSMTDYVSAFLMSEYSRAFSFTELLALPGVSPATL